MKFVLFGKFVGASFALLFVIAPTPARCTARVALVIGNGNYADIAALENAPKDARLMATTLAELGFDVIRLLDANQKEMKIAIGEFGDRLEKAGNGAVGLFYYAGHGVQVDGSNYLIPVNASIEKESQVDIESVDVDFVMKTIALASDGAKFVILDSCRNNPYKSSFRSASRGLARVTAPFGTLVAYATAPGSVASDGRGGGSPYTEALVEAMNEPGLLVEQVFKKVRVAVIKETRSAQIPWEESSLTGDFYFKGDSPSQASRKDHELAFWEEIRDSPDVADVLDYLKKYPEGNYAGMAERRLSALIKTGAKVPKAADLGSCNGVFTKRDRKGRQLADTATKWACVMDCTTGLIWEAKQASGVRDRDRRYAWEDAVSSAPTDLEPGMCGAGSWGVPNRTELNSITDRLKSDPYLYVRYFPNTRPGWYWSATTDPENDNYAYGINFDTGESGMGGKGNRNYVRLVADGPSR